MKKMKLKCFFLILCLVTTQAFAQKSAKSKKGKTPSSVLVIKQSPLANAKDSAAYSIGVMLSGQFKDFVNGDFDSLNMEKIYLGMKDAIGGKDTLIKKDAMQAFFQTYYEGQTAAANQKKLDKEKAFLADNKMKEGVASTPSGLQYIINKNSTGVKPYITDSVVVHYTGKLLNGDVFDSSYNYGEPVGFRLTQVIPGWTEGLQLMSVGSNFTFYIPSFLAYGEQGSPAFPGEPQAIGANETLIFEVELFEVHK